MPLCLMNSTKIFGVSRPNFFPPLLVVLVDYIPLPQMSFYQEFFVSGCSEYLACKIE